ncbi:MAG: trypsin-like peptidase domain-containing protein [Candidatus Dormibacter sp.]
MQAPSQSTSTSGAKSLEDEFTSLVTTVVPSVVQIESPAGLGSGVVYDAAGHIVTNAHVVGAETQFTVTAANGTPRKATLLGSYATEDLAVLQVDGGGLRAAVFADSATVKVGQIVLAVGNPLGLSSSVTDGIVSATGRLVAEPSNGAAPGTTLRDTIQTSAAINPGNSGGALVDLAGRVIGIPTLAAHDAQLGGAAAGIGFAIPSNTVRDIADQLIKDGKVTHSRRAYLGVQTAVATDGVAVASTTAGGPAERAGIRAGDVIAALAGSPVRTPQDLRGRLAALEPGQTIEVRLIDGELGARVVPVTLGELPGTP